MPIEQGVFTFRGLLVSLPMDIFDEDCAYPRDERREPDRR